MITDITFGIDFDSEDEYAIFWENEMLRQNSFSDFEMEM